MRKPSIYMPSRWRETDFARYYAEGWQHAVLGIEHRYSDVEAGMGLITELGTEALQAYQAYEEGYKAGQAAAD